MRADAAKLILRGLRVDDEASFKEAIEVTSAEYPSFGFAFEWNEAAAKDFPGYVARVEGWSQGRNLPARFVPNTYLVGVVDGVVVGRLSLRHRLNDFLREIGGHIGYAVIPSCRKKGYATRMLQLALPLSAELGIERVLLTCDVTNDASRKVIEKCGGVFDGITNTPELRVQKRRYWIDTGAR